MAPRFAIYFKFIYHETDNENNEKRPLFMVSGQLFHSKKRLTEADLKGEGAGVAQPRSWDDLRLSTTVTYKICCIVWYVFSTIRIMLLPSQKPSSILRIRFIKFVYVTSQLRHCLVVHPLPDKNPGSAPVLRTTLHKYLFTLSTS